ncbi:ankyrin repeat domain-containing protein [Cohnella candidum]|nr:ankyrin repeat domain-containing protein [Cohnella candidum]
MFTAALKGNLKALKKIINTDNINAGDKDGYTALHWASQNGHVNIVRFLLANGANPNVIDYEGFTPIEVATTHGNIEVVKALLAVETTDLSITRNGYTPLHSAAACGHLDILQLLISEGMDIECRDSGGVGYTPLHWAVQENHFDVTKFLVRRGANVNVKDADGFSALYIAASNGYIEIIGLLLSSGAEIDIKCEGSKNCTPLHIAVCYGHFDSVKMLIKHNASLNAIDNNAQTSLHYAYINNHSEIISVLEEHGADTTIKDSYGKLASEYLDR